VWGASAGVGSYGNADGSNRSSEQGTDATGGFLD
jgi:hypothetical protein